MASELDRGAVQHADADSDRMDRGAVEYSNDAAAGGLSIPIAMYYYMQMMRA